RRYSEGNFENARKLAAWKAQVRQNWASVRIRRLDAPPRSIPYGDGLKLEVGVFLDGMKPEDVMVELLIGRRTDREELGVEGHYRFEWEGVMTEQGEHRFVLQITPEMCGKLQYRLRIYPYHELLTHPFEMGMMRWL